MGEQDQFEVEEVPTSKGSMVLIWVILIVVLAGLGFFFYGRVVEGYHAARLLAGHETTQGTITKSGFARDPAKYRVFLEGNSYTGFAGRQTQGESIEIAYIPGSPAINRPAGSLWFDAIAGGLIVLAVPVGLTVIILQDRKFAEYKRKAEKRRLREQAKAEKAKPSSTD